MSDLLVAFIALGTFGVGLTTGWQLRGRHLSRSPFANCDHLWTPWREVCDSVYEGPLCRQRQCMVCELTEVAPL